MMNATRVDSNYSPLRGHGIPYPAGHSRAAGQAARTCTPRSRSRSILAVLALLAVLLAIPALTASPAQASTSTLGGRILSTAETKAGHWYSYGAAGPTYFDCSGLAVWAAARHGISIPRTTYGMLAGSAHLYRIPLSWARRGDLLFWGTGHVEFNTLWSHTSFGAHHSGTRVSWQRWNSYYAPTMAMRFR